MTMRTLKGAWTLLRKADSRRLLGMTILSLMLLFGITGISDDLQGALPVTIVLVGIAALRWAKNREAAS